MRVGSSYIGSGGTVHVANKRILRPDYNSRTVANDIGILSSATEIEFNKFVAPGSLAGKDYSLSDNEPVWVVGWGVYNLTTRNSSEQLREVEVYTINREICNDRYQVNSMTVREHMFCTGILDVGGKDQCQGDSGGPVYHKNVVVGVCSWGAVCGSPVFPGVNSLVSFFSDWISDNS